MLELNQKNGTLVIWESLCGAWYEENPSDGRIAMSSEYNATKYY